MVVNLGTFSSDHIFRDAKGVPLGRIILKDDSSYKYNMDEIPVVLLRVPLTTSNVRGLKGYIDGVQYEVPTDLIDFKVNRRERDWTITNFYLRKL